MDWKPDWTPKISEKPIGFKILKDLCAVRPNAGLLETTLLSLLSWLAGDRVSDTTLLSMVGQIAVSGRQVFDKAGWHFIHPSKQFSLAAKIRNAVHERHVYATETGSLLIGTRLATVQFLDDMTPSHLDEALKSDQLSVVYKLGFAKNLFEVRLREGPPYPELIDKLQANTSRYLFAEPSLLETICGRSGPDVDPEKLDLERQWQHLKPRLLPVRNDFGIDSLEAWKVTKGGGINGNRPVRIAVIDNGMQITHPELAPGIIGGGFFLPADGNTATPDVIPLVKGMSGFPKDVEDVDHGTFCMGMAGARINRQNDLPPCGSAPEADLIAIACAPDQTTTQTTLARAIEFAVNPTGVNPQAKPEGGADIISCSLETGVFRDVLKKAIASVKSGRITSSKPLGTPIFWAVENKAGEISNDDVCSHPEVIAVGKSDQQGNNIESATGEHLEFLAPGVNVLGIVADSATNVSGGTSFATPLAAGVAALVLSINPNLCDEKLRKLLQESCEPPPGKTSGQRDDIHGFGIVNSAKAVQKALESLGPGHN